MRRALLSALILPALVLGFAGCGDSDEPVATPAACLTEPAAWLTALGSAPDQVELDESTPISECVPADQPAGPQAAVGSTAVEVATTLSRGMRGEAQAGVPTGESAATAAGYLVGALERGAEKSEGIHATLVDRVEAAATNNLGEGQEFQGAYQQGYEAGLESG